MKFRISLIAILLLPVVAYSLDPRRNYKYTPDKFGMKYETVKIPSTEGVELHAWYFPAPEKSRKLMVISDDGDGNMADNFDIVNQFVSLGYNVLTYDYRGYGQSSDFEVDREFYIYAQFADDLNSVCDFARKKYTQNFALYGLGIGGGLSLGIGYNRKDVVHVVADSPFMTLEDYKKKLASEEGEEILIPYGYNKNYEPYYALDNEPQHDFRGTLIIVGEDDEVIGPDEAGVLEKKRKDLMEVYEVDDATRDETTKKDKDAYFEAIKEFFEEY